MLQERHLYQKVRKKNDDLMSCKRCDNPIRLKTFFVVPHKFVTKLMIRDTFGGELVIVIGATSIAVLDNKCCLELPCP